MSAKRPPRATITRLLETIVEWAPMSTRQQLAVEI